MDPDFLAYFGRRSQQLLLGEPAALPEFRRFEAPEVRQAQLLASGAVQAARGHLRPTIALRPDAEVLLYSIAYELVTRPVLTVEPTSQPQLASDIAADAATVVQSAASRVDGDVTSHAVVEGLSENWNQLRVGSWRVWDRYHQ